MCRVDYADEDGLWLREPSTVKAAKDHACEDCGRLIAKGEIYYYAVWKSDRLYTVKACDHCVRAGRWLKVICGGHLWPGVIEELVEHWEEEWELRSLGLGRLVLAGRRRWRHRNGRMVSLAEVDAWTADALAHTPVEARRAA